jgi:hypothetical protein
MRLIRLLLIVSAEAGRAVPSHFHDLWANAFKSAAARKRLAKQRICEIEIAIPFFCGLKLKERFTAYEPVHLSEEYDVCTQQFC